MRATCSPVATGAPLQMTGLDIAAYLDRDDSPVSFGAWRSAMPKLAATPPV